MKYFLVSIDDLLDTRLALGLRLNKEVGNYWIENKDNVYTARLHESLLPMFFKKDLTWWYNEYDKRDIDLLKDSVVTRVPDEINEILLDYKRTNESNIPDIETTLHVNLYPYRFTADEKEELKKLLFEIMPLFEQISFVEYSLAQLSVPLIKKAYHFVFMYDFHRWMDIHGKSARETLLTSCHIFIPKLLYKLPTENMVNTEFEKKIWDMNPFKLMEAFMVTRFRIVYLPVSTFCAKILIDTTPPETSSMDHPQNQVDPYVSTILDNFPLDLQSSSPQGSNSSSG